MVPIASYINPENKKRRELKFAGKKMASPTVEITLRKTVSQLINYLGGTRSAIIRRG